MASYKDLIEDARSIGVARLTRVSERILRRLLYDSIQLLVNEVAAEEPRTHLLPRIAYDKTVDDAGLVAGIDLSPATGKIAAILVVIAEYTSGKIRSVHIVDADDQGRYSIRPRPAAFYRHPKLYPIVGEPETRTATALKNTGEWLNVSKLQVEAIAEPAAPASESDMTGVHDAFSAPAVLRAVSILARDPAIRDQYAAQRSELLDRAGKGTLSADEYIRG